MTEEGMWAKTGAAFMARCYELATSRTHAQVCCLDCAEGKVFVFYDSGNLRTAKSTSN